MAVLATFLPLVKGKVCVLVVYPLLGWPLGDWLASVTAMALDFAALVETN